MSICLDDCRQSSASAHVHRLRNEQCACAYNLNKTRWLPRWCVCMFDQVLDQTANKLLVES